MSDLLLPLLNAIEAIRTRVSGHKTYLEGHETRTRVSLVDPVLRALGWNPSDPKSVALEYKIEAKSADYALLNDDGKPVAIVEAKTIGKSLGGMDQLGQIGMYALGGSVGLVALTDGDRWRLHDLKKVHSAGGVVFDVTLSRGQPQAIAVQLLELWRPYLLVKHRVAPEQREDDRQTLPSRPMPPPRRSLSDAGWVSLEQVPPSPEPPPKIRFTDESVVALTDWPDLQMEVVRWLHEQGDLEKVTIPFRHARGAKPSIRHQTEPPTWQWRSVPKTDFEVSTVGTSQTVLDRVQRLLEACEHPASVLAQVRE